MRIDELLAAVAVRGVELVRYCHHVSATSARARGDIAERFSIPGATAGRWLNLATALLGPLDDASESSLRSHAITRAEDLGLSIDVLLTINTALRYRHDNAPMSREELRAELVEKSAGLSVDDVKAMSSARVREVNEGLVPEVDRARRYFRASRTTDALGMRHAHLYLPEDDLATLERNLHERAVEMRKSDDALTHQQAMADALLSRTGAATANPWLQPAVLITMSDLEKRGDGTFATTDGTLITAAEYATQKLAPYGLCLVYDADAQPVDLFRISRFANDKQRTMINLDQLLCADPRCTHTAATSQIHHITPWSQGGNTNLDNLVGACGTHNAQNDDHPTTARNGKLQRCPDTGRAGWTPPDGGPMRFNRRPIIARSGRNWALSVTQK